jgi:hypothetical protein
MSRRKPRQPAISGSDFVQWLCDKEACTDGIALVARCGFVPTKRMWDAAEPYHDWILKRIGLKITDGGEGCNCDECRRSRGQSPLTWAEVKPRLIAAITAWKASQPQ